MKFTVAIRKTFCVILCATAFFAFSWSAYAEVKKSKSKICHPPDSPYYSRTKNYTPYPTLNACLSSGGRLPKNYKPTVSRGSAAAYSKTASDSGYSRSKFGSGWDDEDGDCQNTRHEMLLEQSLSPVSYKSSRGCQVTHGRWISPLTNEVIYDSSKIDIDHLVPLKWAWDHGSRNWDQARREEFANDPVNLLSVEASLNRQKGAKGPAEWLPPSNRCGYVSRFTRVVKRYRLTLTDGESRSFKSLLADC